VKRLLVLVAVVALVAPLLDPTTQPALASHTLTPSSVTIAGNLQSELGCPGDWQPDCAATHLAYDAGDDVWQVTFTLPAGSWEYKAALNDSWAENYGRNATRDGANLALSLATPTNLKFYYDHKSHWITDNRGATIAVAPGSFQSELGCAGDWDPSCLRSWLQDVEGDGIYVFETTALPAGSYETKVAIDESWTENYGPGGVRDGANIPFAVPHDGARVTFTYNATSHVLTVVSEQSDNNIEWNGLRHDSRDLLYRTPGGAVPAGTPVTIRFRTFHDDVTVVALRSFDVNAAAQRTYPMALVARDVSCYEAALATESCDFWGYTVTSTSPNNLWYRFVVSDGAATAYYADNTAALDGGAGAPSATPIDQSYALMFYDPAFTAPDWARTAVIYQLFPDRFRNGNPGNDPVPGASRRFLSTDPRYAYPGGDPTGASRPEWDQIIELPWAELPEGYCRSYAPGAPCPQRFPQPAGSRETPRGRDYFGGDLQGVTKQLDHLASLGVTAIYFNPIFDSASNHGYDTQDYYAIDPYFGDLDHFETLVREASRRGMRVILDGVFNHVSSDSRFFDRYHHYPGNDGACESAASPYRAWFHFRAPQGSEPSPCAPSTPGGTDTYYDGWFGFDSIPVLTKSLAEVQRYFVSGPNSVTRYWLNEGASGWRLDVMGDASFPDGYWESFREVVKTADPDALIVGELWQKDSTLLRFLRGDRADTTMNYRLRDAVIAFLATGPFDAKGFADSGHSIPPSAFAERMASQREDYADAAYYTLMNILDSHDTERLLWTLTPGAETRADRELDATNVAAGKRAVRIASLIQFTMPGAPTIYYGDEVGLTGDDDPDDRRTYPWADLGGSPDTSLLQHYRTLAALRRDIGALTAGDLRMLLADDAAGTLAYGRKTTHQAAIVAVNRSDQPRTLNIRYTLFLPDGTPLRWRYGGTGSMTLTGGVLQVTLAPLSAALLATDIIDLDPPAPPAGLHVTAEGNSSVGLTWNASPGAASYNVYRSPVTGGGWVKANASPLAATSFTDTGLRNARTYYYVVRALDALGNESGPSNEVSAVPHYTIGWANLQWPPTLTDTISAVRRTDNVYGQVWIDGVTSMPGATPTLRAQLGFGPDGSDPATDAGWSWVEAQFNTDVNGANDEFVASLLPDAVGQFDYAYRYTTTDGRDWVYADLDGIQNGYSPAQAGALTVNASSDTTAPATPSGLHVTTANATQVVLAWNAVSGDPTLYGYEVRRGTSAGGPYATIAFTSAAGYTDTNVTEGATYYYVVRSVDTSFNRSVDSVEVSATAALRTVTVTFTVTVPATTDATGRSVHIAGTLSRLDGALPDWDPGATVLIRLDATHWRITLTGKETTQLEYKYTLGDWEHVEKGASCDELANRQLTLVYGATGTQAVNDTVQNWRNVAPCGN